MLRWTLGGLTLSVFLVGAAHAACPNFPYSFTNGTTADASQLNTNFSNVITCFAPLASPSFTGNVGIGLTSPAQKLEVNGNIQFDGSRLITGVDGGNNFWLKNNQGTEIGGDLSFGYQTNGAGVVTAVFMATSGITRVFLNSAGSLGIGTATPSYTLHVNGSVAGTSAYNNLSDVRLKKDVTEVRGGLALIEKLRGVRFRWRKPEEREIGKDFSLPVNESQVGFIAQEVEPVLPEAVTHTKDGIYSIQESKIVPAVVEAIKEQQTEIADLSRTVAALQATNETLRRKVDQTDHSADETFTRRASR